MSTNNKEANNELERSGDYISDEIIDDSVDDEEIDGSDESPNKTSKNNINFPNVMAALKAQANRQDENALMLASLPKIVKRRIKALKRLQLDATNIETEFFKEVHQLECKYYKLYVPLYEKRNVIVNGKHEPTDEEAIWSSDEEGEDDDQLSDALKDKVKIEGVINGKEHAKFDENVKGIPEFWLTVFKNCNLVFDMIQPHDIPLLQHLTDVKTITHEDPMGFTVEFYFSPNEYFTNTVLTKYYHMKCEPEKDDPFSFEGPEIFRCEGCTINWNKGKNITLKVVKKKQKHKSRGVVRVVTKTVQNDSFFNFFTPPVVPADAKDEDIDEDVRNLLTSDFEIGHYIRDRVIPRAVLFYTGEAADDEDDCEEEEEDDDDEEDDENESDGGRNRDSQCPQQ